MSYLSFLTKDEKEIFVEEEILRRSQVITNILNLDGKFLECTNKIGNSFLFFEELNILSVLIIIEYLKIDGDNINIKNFQDYSDEYIYLEPLRNYIRYINETDFIETIIFSHRLCIMIPSNLHRIINKAPKNREEDILGKYQYFDYHFYGIGSSSFKDVNMMLFRYLNDGWVICEQNMKGNDSSMKGNIRLRKKLI